jgi:hypothetical protein
MSKPTQEEVEKAAAAAQESQGAPQYMVFVDPATGEQYRIDTTKLTKEQAELLYKAGSR